MCMCVPLPCSFFLDCIPPRTEHSMGTVRGPCLSDSLCSVVRHWLGLMSQSCNAPSSRFQTCIRMLLSPSSPRCLPFNTSLLVSSWSLLPGGPIDRECLHVCVLVCGALVEKVQVDSKFTFFWNLGSEVGETNTKF